MASTRRSLPRRVVAATGALAALLVVGGCGDAAAPEPSPSATTATPAATAGADAGPTPSPTTAGPTATPPADADALVVRSSGVGDLTVGAPPATNPGASLLRFDAAACASQDQPADPSVTGRWLTTLGPFTDASGEARPRIAVAADDAAVSRIDVLDPALRTAEGVGIGTTLADLQATYPGLVEGTAGPTSRVFWVDDPAGTLVFETQDDSQGLQPPGTPPTVILVRVLAPGVDPDFVTANTDDVAGGCL